MFKKKLYNYKDSLDLCQVLQRKANKPCLVVLNKPPRGIFSFGAASHCTVLSLKPLELRGDCDNIVVDARTLSFI